MESVHTQFSEKSFPAEVTGVVFSAQGHVLCPPVFGGFGDLVFHAFNFLTLNFVGRIVREHLRLDRRDLANAAQHPSFALR